MALLTTRHLFQFQPRCAQGKTFSVLQNTQPLQQVRASTNAAVRISVTDNPPGPCCEWSLFLPTHLFLPSQIHSVELDPNLPEVIYINTFGGRVADKAKFKMGVVSTAESNNKFDKLRHPHHRTSPKFAQICPSLAPHAPTHPNPAYPIQLKRTFGGKNATPTSSTTSLREVVSTQPVLAGDEYLRFQWHMALSRVVRDFWQPVFEKDVLTESEHYRSHSFVMKWNKDRVLLISNAWIYNVEVSYLPAVTLGEMKWAIPISSLKQLEVGGPLDTAITIHIDAVAAGNAAKTLDKHMGGRTKALNEQHDWVFFSHLERNQQCRRLQSIFKDITGENLPLKSQPAPSGEELKQVDSKSVLEGYMEKVGGDMTGWKKRYFILTKTHLEYFRKYKDKKPAGEVSISSKSTVRFIDRLEAQGKSFAFALVPQPGERAYYFACANEADRSLWMGALRRVASGEA